MGEVVNTAGQTVRLEQVVLHMPEARFYFSGEREAKAEELRAFIGDEELSFVSLERFSQTGGGICYYVLLDVSASITEEEFGGIKEALAGFAEGLSEQDRMVFITFGEQVQTVFEEDGAALGSGSAREKILALENTDQKTLLFEAIDRMAELSDGAQAQSGMRRAAFVITDGEDIARGKATRQEAERTLKESGVPVYGFTVSGAGKEAEDAFGEFSRESGGTLTILEPGREAEGLAAVKERLMNSWEAVFEADSNRVANGMVNVSLEFTDTGEKKQTQAMQNRWQADEEAPVVLEAFPEGEKQLRVTFSEAVTGADAAEHYELSAADGQILVPVYASAQEGGTEAVLTFDALPAGAYELHCTGLKDVSMEENEMDCVFSVLVEGQAVQAETAVSTEAEGSVPAGYAAAGGAALVLTVCLFVLLIGKKRAKKRRENAGQEGRDKEAGNRAGGSEKNTAAPDGVVGVGLQPNRRVKVERRDLEELTVHFQARGQKDEIDVVVQKSMIVGRSAACELSFDDPALSRQHFSLEISEGGLWIRNLSQSGFTLVNGVKLQEKAVRLRSGDWIGAGQLQLRIRF
ncbi:MAG TPA: VWA domain-containing protein [Candidatus Eisenbergiella stercorigallinarum]|uniref:VWA domain-containing protein n=1 Tax=Candidatus Eisenbergiella stercorigallinarum TaxID=2838557 RepID=A0A9D2QXA0_9FIRM|nr:VWA domain-containing protein [Candidatus Eisenbergiella stercorigallinarum]